MITDINQLPKLETRNILMVTKEFLEDMDKILSVKEDGRGNNKINCKFEFNPNSIGKAGGNRIYLNLLRFLEESGGDYYKFVARAKGINYHEFAHINYRMKLSDYQIAQLNKHKWLHKSYNILLDCRDEAFMYEEFRAVREHFIICSYYYNYKPLMSGQSMISPASFALLWGRRCYLPQVMVYKVEQLIESLLKKEDIERLKQIIDEFMGADKGDTMFTLAEKFAELMQEFTEQYNLPPFMDKLEDVYDIDPKRFDKGEEKIAQKILDKVKDRLQKKDKKREEIKHSKKWDMDNKERKDLKKDLKEIKKDLEKELTLDELKKKVEDWKDKMKELKKEEQKRKQDAKKSKQEKEAQEGEGDIFEEDDVEQPEEAPMPGGMGQEGEDGQAGGGGQGGKPGKQKPKKEKKQPWTLSRKLSPEKRQEIIELLAKSNVPHKIVPKGTAALSGAD